MYGHESQCDQNLLKLEPMTKRRSVADMLSDFRQKGEALLMFGQLETINRACVSR